MAGLIMKLAPNERFLVNGALIANGDRRGMINVLQSTAVVIRESALVTPEIVQTDLGRLVLLAQNALLGLIERDLAMNRLHTAIHAVCPDVAIAEHLWEASTSHAGGDLRGVYISLSRAFRIESRGAATAASPVR